MKSSRIFKKGTILLIVALVVGASALIVWANGNETNGIGKGSGGNIDAPRYGMQNSEVSNQAKGLGNQMSNSVNAPDDDGDGIPNGQDENYVSECDGECDGTCDSEPKGVGMRRNSSDNPTGLQAHVSGMQMKTMTITELAAFWGVDAGKLLEGIQNEFKLTQGYNIENTIDDLRGEFRFSPHQIMEIAEKIKTD